MLEKLLSLLLHAKGGAIATVLVIGASGALVTATVENGTTTTARSADETGNHQPLSSSPSVLRNETSS